MKKSFFYLILLIFCSCPARAQDAVSTTEQLIADIFEQYAAESEETIDYDSFYEDLLFCSQNQVNLNRATRDELERLPFLTDIQIENILSYVYQLGPMQTVYELQLIEGLDMTDIRRMLPFVAVGEANETKNKIYWNDLLKYGKNELYFRVDKGMETKEGYQFLHEEGQNSVENNSKKYLGNEIYHSLKYRYHFKDRIQIGLTAEKDAGEQFWGTTHKGYDFYSGSAQLNDFKKFKTIVVGDFRANFGQGLVLRPEFGMGKSSYVLNVIPRSSGLKNMDQLTRIIFSVVPALQLK